MVGFMGKRMSATVCLLVEWMSIEGLMMGEMNFGVTCDFVYMHSQLSLYKKVKESLFQIYELMIIQIKDCLLGTWSVQPGMIHPCKEEGSIRPRIIVETNFF